MTHNVIILPKHDQEKSRYGFGVNNEGNIYLSLAKIPINKENKCLVFTFVGSYISVSIKEVEVVAQYNIETYQDVTFVINEDSHLNILNKMKELYLSFPAGLGQRNYYYNKCKVFKINSLIYGLVKIIYQKMTSHYKLSKSVDLKKEIQYERFFKEISGSDILL